MKQVVSILSCLALLIVGASTATAKTPEIRAVASKTDVLIAETFTFRVEAIVEPGCRIEFSEPAAEGESIAKALGVFDIIAAADLEDVPLSTADEDQRLWSRTYTLETIRLGEQTIPSIGVSVTCDGQSTALQTDPVAINVAGVIEKADEPLREIAGIISREPESSSPPRSDRIIGLAGALFAATILAALTVWYRRRGSEPLRWCADELSKLRVAVESFTSDAETDTTRWVEFTQRLREILRVALTVYLYQSRPSPSTSRLISECQQVAPELDFQACESVLGRADAIKFSASGTTPSLNEVATTRSNQAIGEAERLIGFVRQSRRDRKRGR
ncbi:hypothetical protein [Neorhodopirellula pilleata]|uniref:MxaA protein n=1 Tax=Neorhodopirellula pilleata TaxID=2714738 RepID=A0A5C6AL07_9BACT|nr:hypothetical protein [Neorhodopirellula pilleata]TWT98873.1 hypothetical protein Pla100_20390 [Neorhodopirellula pilleata]